MRTDKVVTVWHFGSSDVPVRKVLKNLSLDFVKRIDKNGIKQKGFFDGSCAAIRIFTTAEIGVNPGDYLHIGECTDPAVPLENALKITEVKDNRRGTQKHWRIVCGG